MDEKINYVTKEGLKKLEEELEELKTTKRKEIALRIQEAKELGDLSENAEYSDAKDEQARVASRVMELEQLLKHTEIIAHRKNTTTVQIGSKLTVKSAQTGEMTFTIVGSSEADPLKQLISNVSPLGSAFLGKNVGDAVEVEAPGGTTKYTIDSVE